jgi:hypothetical protein
MNRILLIILLVLPISLMAQTITDGLMMPKKNFCTGFMYGQDQWKNYWEGERKRDNLNIGKVTTQSITYMGNYGITDKINVIAMVPYIWTKASKGTLHSIEGVQDLTLAVKYNFFKKAYEGSSLNTFAGVSYSTPLTNYTADYLPLSIGMESQNISWRLTGNYSWAMGLYANASGAYTWRSNVSLDRSSYYTNGNFYSSDEVKMPNVFDYIINVGFRKKGLQLDVSYNQQNTLGGGDIRRQDMPFVSNRMNYSKVGFLVMYYLPNIKALAVRGMVNQTVAGRNVGESTTFMAGALYTFHFFNKQ